jgi:hypothetical protein
MAANDPRPPTRAELATFLPNQRNIKAFEKIFDLIPSTLNELEDDIATNAINIATNAANITTNAANIATNVTNIAANSQRIKTNEVLLWLTM